MLQPILANKRFVDRLRGIRFYMVIGATLLPLT